MTISILAFGIATDILGSREISLSFPGQTLINIEQVKQVLLEQYPAFKDLASLRFAVGETYRDDDFKLTDGTEVVIIPPVAGG